MSGPAREDRPSPNSYWVVPGHFAAGEYPGAIESHEASRKVRSLLGAGIDYFIDLTEPGELLPFSEIAEDEARRLDVIVGHERQPITDLSVPHSPEQMSRILDAIDGAMDNGKTVYLHCWGGVGRTGTVVGCWLVRHGRTGDSALSQIAEWWNGMSEAKLANHPCSPETFQQCEYVRNWTEPSRER